MAGYDFMYAANVAPNKAYAIPSGPFYQFLAAVSVNIPFLTVIILGCFLFWSLPSMIANTFMPIRSFFAWSFDRLMPEKLADVNDRTHSPVIAIVTVNVIIAALVIWSVTSNVFQLVLGLIVLAGCLGVVIIAIAAIALPLRRPELYRGRLPAVLHPALHPGPPRHQRQLRLQGTASRVRPGSPGFAPTTRSNGRRNTRRRPPAPDGEGTQDRAAAFDAPRAARVDPADGEAAMAREIDRDEVQRLMARGAQIVDVLPAREYREDHLPGAINLPLRKIEAEALRVLDPSRPVVVYCADPG